MAERDELELMRALSAARGSGDSRAELEALRALSALRSQSEAPMQPVQPGGSVSGVINRGGPFPGGALEAPAPQTQRRQPSAADAFGRQAAARLVSNILGTPGAAGELLAASAAGLQAGAGEVGEFFGGQEQPIGQRFSEARQQQQGDLPASLLRAIPSPSPETVEAVGRTVGNLPRVISGPETIGGEFQAQRQMVEQRMLDQPGQSMAANAVGDIGTLLAGRPITRNMFRSARTRPPREREAVDAIDSAANRLTRATGFAKRLGSQAAEAGFEGALLSAMQGGDPLAAAGWAAGAQAGGNFALQGTRAFVKYPWRSLGGVALAHWIYRALAPGGQGALEDVRDESIQTMLTTFGLGALAAMTGAGRMAQGRTAGRDRFIDAFDSMRRTPITSIIAQLSEADQSGDTRLNRVVEKIAEDPDYFGRETRMRIERAARSERENALRREVDNLMRSERFRRRFDAIGQENSE